MEDLIPILLQFIRSRQQPNGFVVLIAHNGRRFDIPFLCHEFSRCLYKIPLDWIFLDTIPVAKDALKSIGQFLFLSFTPYPLCNYLFPLMSSICFDAGLKGNSGFSLQALVELYEIAEDGPAHRALSDVNVLSKVFQRLTFDLKLTASEILEKYHFTCSDLGSSKNKKSSSSK